MSIARLASLALLLAALAAAPAAVPAGREARPC
jgi:hypothetical protein